MNPQNNNNNSMRLSFGSGVQIPMQMQVPMQMQIPATQNQQQIPHLLSQPQPQSRPYFPGHFKHPEPQPQSFVQNPPQAMSQAQRNPNIGISSPPISTPGTVKRQHKPASRPSGGSSGQAAAAASPMKTMELAPASRRGKRKVPDKAIPEKVAAILPESALYTQLLEFESRVDAALARKKADIVDSLKTPLRTQKVLRIYVFNTCANQANLDKENAGAPSWSLRIIGRVLEDGKDPGMEMPGQKSDTLNPKFSSFLKKMTVYLDQSLYPDNHVILWESSRSPVIHEGFEVKRKGDKEFTAIVRLEMNYAPEKFKLSPALQEVLGIEVESRSKILTGVWHYVKIRNLQVPGDTSSFMCDPCLRKVFGEDKLKFSLVNQKIAPHLAPPGPIHLEHRIKLSGASPSGNTCYDVLVDVPLLPEKEMSTFLGNIEKNKEIDACDEAISSSVKKIHEHLRRRAFFLGFSQSPGEFINTLIDSQSRDLKLAAGDASRDVEKEQRAEFYNQPWAEDAVIRYLNRKSAVSGEAAGNK